MGDHEEIKRLVAQLQELKAQLPAAPPAADTQKTSPKMSPKKEPAAAIANGGDIEAQIRAVGDEIRVLKEKLKDEGISGKKLNDHEEIKRFAAQLQELKAQLPAAPPAADTLKTSPKMSPKKEPAAAPAVDSGDVEAQIKEVGDEIRV